MVQGRTAYRPHDQAGLPVCTAGDYGYVQCFFGSSGARCSGKPLTRFATDDDDAASTKERDVSDLGTIKIRCVRVRQVMLPQPKPQRYGRFREVGPVHERSKKAGAHRISYVLTARVSPLARREGLITSFSQAG